MYNHKASSPELTSDQYREGEVYSLYNDWSMDSDALELSYEAEFILGEQIVLLALLNAKNQIFSVSEDRVVITIEDVRLACRNVTDCISNLIREAK